MIHDSIDRKAINNLAESFESGQHLLRSLYNYLTVQNWTHVAEQVVEVIPHFAKRFSIRDLEKSLSPLGLTQKKVSLNKQCVNSKLLPAILLDTEGGSSVIYGEEECYYQMGEFGDVAEINWPQEFSGTLLILQDKTETVENTSWFRRVFLRSKIKFSLLLFLSTLANILLLMTPLYVMFVYDKVLSAHSTSMLFSILIGMLIILVSYWFIQKRRRQILADICSYSVQDVDNSILSKLLKLPSQYTEVSSISSQITRVQDYEGIHETFAKTILTTLVDLPFYIIFLGIFYFIAGPLVIVPIVGAVVFTLLTGLRILLEKYFAVHELQVDTGWRSFLIESIQKMKAIREAHFEKPWMKRFAAVTAKTVQDRYQESYKQSFYEIIGDSVSLMLVLSLLSFGVYLVDKGYLTVGGLIAGMILIWQMMSPIKNFYNRAKQFTSFKKTLYQIDRLNQIEQEEYGHIGDKPALNGLIEFNQVGLRYSAEREPALYGVSFKIEPGQLVVLTGPNGSGKSTILKLIMRLYQQQVGTISVDGLDIRQTPHNLLRKSIAYAPQNPRFFYGTILQNLQLASPLATLKEITEVCEYAGVLQDIKQLPNGFETRIKDNDLDNFPASFKQRLQLARTLLMQTPIILLDEPVSHLDKKQDKHFLKLIQNLKGLKTIVMTTHRPSHFKLADKVIFLEKGQVSKVEEKGSFEQERVSNA